MPSASVGDMIICSVKKGKPELRKKGKLYNSIKYKHKYKYKQKENLNM